MQFNSLSYKNVKLRPLEPEDLEYLYKWENDPEIWTVSNTLTPFSRFVLRKYIEESVRDITETKQLRLIIEDVDSNVVGAIDLFDYDSFHRRAGVGILIYEDDSKRKGLATSALNLIMQYAENVLNINQLYANMGVANTASIALFEKLGFQRVGIKEKWNKTPNGWSDEILYQKLF